MIPRTTSSTPAKAPDLTFSKLLLEESYQFGECLQPADFQPRRGDNKVPLPWRISALDHGEQRKPALFFGDGIHRLTKLRQWSHNTFSTRLDAVIIT